MFKVNNRVVMERKRLGTESASACTMNESGSYYKEGKLQVRDNPTGFALPERVEKNGTLLYERSEKRRQADRRTRLTKEVKDRHIDTKTIRWAAPEPGRGWRIFAKGASVTLPSPHRAER
jgi:hypothetical protein